MCHFGVNINFKTEFSLFEYNLLPFYKIYMYRSLKYLNVFIYLFIYLIFVSLDQLIFCTREISLNTKLYNCLCYCLSFPITL